MDKLTFDPIVELAKMTNLPENLFGWFYVLFVVVLIIVILLKGLALWRAATNGQKVWFWVLLIVNTMGILEIIYLLAVKPKKKSTSGVASSGPINLPQ